MINFIYSNMKTMYANNSTFLIIAYLTHSPKNKLPLADISIHYEETINFDYKTIEQHQNQFLL